MDRESHNLKLSPINYAISSINYHIFFQENHCTVYLVWLYIVVIFEKEPHVAINYLEIEKKVLKL